MTEESSTSRAVKRFKAVEEGAESLGPPPEPVTEESSTSRAVKRFKATLRERRAAAAAARQEPICALLPSGGRYAWAASMLGQAAAPASSSATSPGPGAPGPGSPGPGARLVKMRQADGHKWTVVKDDRRKQIANVPDGLKVEIVDENQMWNSYKVRKTGTENWDPPEITEGWVRRHNCDFA